MKRISLALIMVFFLAGCSTRIVDFTLITSKNIDLSRMPTFKRDTKRVTGEDVVHIIIFIPTGIPNAKEALDRAIESVPGAVALVDGVMTREGFYIPYIYGQDKFVVEGTALIDPQLRANLNTNDNNDKYHVVMLSEAGQLESSTQVAKEDYEKLVPKI